MRKTNVSEWDISILGAGTMGLRLAQFFATKGHAVKLYNRTSARLEQAVTQILSNLSTLLELKQISESDIAATLQRIITTDDLPFAVADADIVIESVAEDADIKKELFARLDELCCEDTILSSNTSTLNLFDFVTVSHPERLILTHFFNPAYVMPLVEVVRGPETSDEVTESVKEFLTSTGKTVAVMNKMIPGFIMNRISYAIFREAAHIVQQGAASAEDVDKAIISTFGPRYAFEGPFGWCDFGGTELIETLCTSMIPDLCSTPDCPEILHTMKAEGKLGVKSGEGFYSYSDPSRAYRLRDAKIIRMMQAIQSVGETSESY